METLINRGYSEGFIPVQKFGSICKANAKGYYTVLSNGDIIKCESNAGDKNVIIGHLSSDGKFVQDIENSIYCSDKDMEYEDCKKCVIYPICGARSCPQKKAISKKNGTPRVDCINMKQQFRDEIEPFIEHKLLKKLLQKDGI